MSLFTNNGEKKALDRFLGLTLTLRLFKNDYTPVAATVAADLTEADFTGYAGKAVAAWPAASTNGGGKAESVHAVQTWTNTGASQTFYGWYITDDTGTVLVAGRFGSAVTLTTGQPFAFTPTLTFVSE